MSNSKYFSMNKLLFLYLYLKFLFIVCVCSYACARTWVFTCHSVGMEGRGQLSGFFLYSRLNPVRFITHSRKNYNNGILLNAHILHSGPRDSRPSGVFFFLYFFTFSKNCVSDNQESWSLFTTNEGISKETLLLLAQT